MSFPHLWHIFMSLASQNVFFIRGVFPSKSLNGSEDASITFYLSNYFLKCVIPLFHRFEFIHPLESLTNTFKPIEFFKHIWRTYYFKKYKVQHYEVFDFLTHFYVACFQNVFFIRGVFPSIRLTLENRNHSTHSFRLIFCFCVFEKLCFC